MPILILLKPRLLKLPHRWLMVTDHCFVAMVVVDVVMVDAPPFNAKSATNSFMMPLSVITVLAPNFIRIFIFISFLHFIQNK